MDYAENFFFAYHFYIDIPSYFFFDDIKKTNYKNNTLI